MSQVKCANLLCSKLTTKKKKYCCRSCAPYGHLTDAPIAHTAWNPGHGGSGILEHGAPSWGSSENEPRNALAESLENMTTPSRPLSSDKESMLVKKESEISSPGHGTVLSLQNDLLTNENTLKELELSGMPGTMQTKTGNLPKSPTDVALANRIETSFVQSDNSNGVLLDSVSLIDRSANHLHGFIASVAKEEVVSGQMMSSAAKCAKELASLMRVKLDLYKASKK